MKVNTVVFNRVGLFLSNVCRHSIHLDFNQRVHNRGFFIVDFGELLPRYDLTADNNSGSYATIQPIKAKQRLE